MLEREQAAIAATLLHGPDHLPAGLFAGDDNAAVEDSSAPGETPVSPSALQPNPGAAGSPLQTNPLPGNSQPPAASPPAEELPASAPQPQPQADATTGDALGVAIAGLVGTQAWYSPMRRSLQRDRDVAAVTIDHPRSIGSRR